MGLVIFIIIWTLWMTTVSFMVWYDSKHRFEPIPFWKLFLIFEFLPFMMVWWAFEKFLERSMINITMKCPKCGKEWIEKVDEHDVLRYIPGLPSKPKSICSCQFDKLPFKDFIHPQPCYNCLDM